RRGEPVPERSAVGDRADGGGGADAAGADGAVGDGERGGLDGAARVPRVGSRRQLGGDRGVAQALQPVGDGHARGGAGALRRVRGVAAPSGTLSKKRRRPRQRGFQGPRRLTAGALTRYLLNLSASAPCCLTG